MERTGSDSALIATLLLHYPVNFFYYYLFYTDTASTMSIVLVYYFALKIFNRNCTENVNESDDDNRNKNENNNKDDITTNSKENHKILPERNREEITFRNHVILLMVSTACTYVLL